MLRDLKQQSSGLTAKIIMGLIIISFVFWGISGQLLSSNNDSAVTVNGEKVTVPEFNLAYQTSKDRMKSQFGDNIGSEYFETENFKRGVMNQLVDGELLKQEAQKFNYDVSPSRVRNYIESSSGLQVDGKFSKEAYANYLSQVNKSAELLQREIRDDLKGSALPIMLNSTSFALESEILTQYKLSKQKRSFDYLEFSSKDYESDVEVTDEEIKNHYNEFSTDYMTDEQVSINYVELSTADLLEQVEINDSDINDYYEKRKKALMTAEKRSAQHILLPVSNNAEEVKVEIDKVSDRINAGEDFAEVAKEVSQDPGSAKQGGDLGWVAQGDMVEAFDKKLFSMSSGEISEAVLSKFGYHIIKLNEVKSPEIPKLDDIKVKLVEELKQERADELFLIQADELDTTIIDSDNVLELAAENSGLELKSTELFARGKGLGIAANPKFSSAAFSDLIKLDNETSELIDLGENHVAYIHVKEHLQPQVKPLEDVKDLIKNKLLSIKATDYTKQKAEGILEKLKVGETTIADLAKETDKSLVEAVDIERTGSKQPYQLVQNVFKLKYQEGISEALLVESSANAFAIVLLKSVVNANSETIEEGEKKSIESQIVRSVGNTEIQNLTKALRDDASVSINEKVFQVQ